MKWLSSQRTTLFGTLINYLSCQAKDCSWVKEEIEGGKRKRLRQFEDSSRYCTKKIRYPVRFKAGAVFLCVVVGQCCCLRWTRSRTSKLSLGWFTLLSNWHKTACYAPIPLLYWIPMWLCGCPGTHERTSMTEKKAKHATCRHLSTQSRLGVYVFVVLV